MKKFVLCLFLMAIGIGLGIVGINKSVAQATCKSDSCPNNQRCPARLPGYCVTEGCLSDKSCLVYAGKCNANTACAVRSCIPLGACPPDPH